MKRIYIGILVIFFGLAWLLSSLAIGGAPELLAVWWPVFIIALGIILLSDSQGNDWLWPLLLVLAGALLLLDTTGVAEVNLWAVLGPLGVIALGLSFVFQSSSTKRLKTTDNNDTVAAILSGVTWTNTSDDFTGSTMTVFMGGIEANLAASSIKKEASIEVFVVMGGLELQVPKGVVVRNRANCILGGIEDKEIGATAKNAPILYIDGTIIMGSVEIKHG